MWARLLEWLRRYLPLEIAATVCSLAGGLGAAVVTTNGGVIAYAATWAENVGFYSYALVREIRRSLGTEPVSLAALKSTLLPSTGALIAEFGAAEVLDSFVVRPACMYLLPKLTGHLAIGLVLGKILADVVFYALAVIAYECGKHSKS